MYARKHYYILSLLVALVTLASCQEKRHDRFEREAREYTQTHCPQPYGDGITTLDSMVFAENGSAGELRLYYSLQLTDEQRERLMDELGTIGDANLSVVRNSVLFAKHKEAGVDFRYVYHDVSSGDKIAEFHFKKEDYQ